jgi:plastocyanin
VLRTVLLGAGASSLAFAAAMVLSQTASAQEPLRIAVGEGDGTVAVQAFLPGAVRVDVGDSITFTIASSEPHMITFGDGPTETPPTEWEASGWPTARSTPGGDPVDLGLAIWNGSGFLHSGLLFEGSSATVLFDTPGTFSFLCPIHPGMTGEVTVLEAGEGSATTQAEADAAGAASAEALLGQAEALRESRTASVESITAADGRTTWNVFADASTVATALPGGGEGYLELLEFVPAELTIRPGDTVHWSARGVHTVTFPRTGQDPATLDPSAAMTADETYDGSTTAHSGLLNAAPGAPSSFTLTFPTAGSFPYVCALHAGLGQVGTIVVSDAP